MPKDLVIPCRRAGESELENIAIRNCKGPAINVSNPLTTSIGISPMPVTFKNIVVANNGNESDGQKFGEIGGGGVGVGPGAEVSVINCTFEGNGATSGGGIWAVGSNLIVTKSVFSSNIAKTQGGAIHIADNNGAGPITLRITDCNFTGNKDTSGGSAAGELRSQSGAPLEAARYPVDQPTNSGGALHVQDVQKVEISNCTFASNFAVPAGGAVFIFLGNALENAIAKLSQNTFLNNEARELEGDEPELAQAGAVYVASLRENTITFENNLFSGNTASYGGAVNVITDPSANVQLEGNIFSDNLAWWGGGAIVLRNMDRAEILNNKASRNKAQFGGAILLANSGGMTLPGGVLPDLNNRFEENEAAYGGAVFLLSAGAFNLLLTLYRFLPLGTTKHSLLDALKQETALLT